MNNKMNQYRYILAILVGSLCMYFLEVELSKTTSQLTAISSAAIVSGCIAGMVAKNYHWLVGILLGLANLFIKFSSILLSQDSGEIKQILSPSLTIFVCTFLSCIVIGLKKRKYEELESESNSEENPSIWIIFLFIGLSTAVWVHYFYFPYSEEFYFKYPHKRYTEPILGFMAAWGAIQTLIAKIRAKH